MKPLLRIITVAWGESYIEKLLSISLPAILSRNNLPVLTEHFSCTFVLVTEEMRCDSIRVNPVWQRLNQICKTELLPLDDLLVSHDHYGVVLTMALFRGFEHLRKEMTDVFLMFFNADFVISDGSFQALTSRMLGGERLIHAPSYCVIEEKVSPRLKARVDWGSCSLAISSREMASLILLNRHLTIQAKTVNQLLISMQYFDQFYWQADDHTLLARQLPIALVCMRPERVVAELHTFWDFGVIDEFCPTTKPCVLNDSDDFLMLELRSERRFRDEFQLGRTSISEISGGLSSYATKSHRDYGRFSLVVHDQDLSSNLHVSEEKFSRFIDQVYKKLSETPVNHIGHRIWLESFKKSQSVHLNDSRINSSDQQIAGERMLEKRSCFHPTKVLWGSRGFFERLHHRYLGKLPFVKRYHPYYLMLRPVTEIIEEALAQSGKKILLVASDPGPLSKLVKSQASEGKGHVIIDGADLLDGIYKSSEGTNALKRQEGKVELANTSDANFDLCICELDLSDLLKFQYLFKRIEALMSSGGQIVVFHFNLMLRDLKTYQTEIILNAVVPVGESEIVFAGSIWAKGAVKLYTLGNFLATRYGGLGRFALYGFVLAALPLTVIATWKSHNFSRNIMPRTCLSLTMKYRLF